MFRFIILIIDSFWLWHWAKFVNHLKDFFRSEPTNNVILTLRKSHNFNQTFFVPV